MPNGNGCVICLKIRWARPSAYRQSQGAAWMPWALRMLLPGFPHEQNAYRIFRRSGEQASSNRGMITCAQRWGRAAGKQATHWRLSAAIPGMSGHAI